MRLGRFCRTQSSGRRTTSNGAASGTQTRPVWVASAYSPKTLRDGHLDASKQRATTRGARQSLLVLGDLSQSLLVLGDLTLAPPIERVSLSFVRDQRVRLPTFQKIGSPATILDERRSSGVKVM